MVDKKLIKIHSTFKQIIVFNNSDQTKSCDKFLGRTHAHPNFQFSELSKLANPLKVPDITVQKS